MSRDERIDRARSAARITMGMPSNYDEIFRPEKWVPPVKEEKTQDRHGIGGNGAPDWDWEAKGPPRPYIMGDMKPVSFDGKTEITSRSQLRAFEAEHGVKQCGLEWTGSDKEPDWFGEYKEKRRWREKDAKRKGKHRELVQDFTTNSRVKKQVPNER